MSPWRPPAACRAATASQSGVTTVTTSPGRRCPRERTDAAQRCTGHEVEDERGPVIGHGHDVAQADEVLVAHRHEHVLLGAGRLLVGEPAHLVRHLDGDRHTHRVATLPDRARGAAADDGLDPVAGHLGAGRVSVAHPLIVTASLDAP